MPDELSVWLHGNHVAVIDTDRGRPRLAYTAEALELYPLGTPLLSLSMPVASRRYTQGVVRPFLDGLLPEGWSRTAIAHDLRKSPTDTFALIGALGRDCAGALVIQPADDPAPPGPTTATAEPLGRDGLEAAVSNLRSEPLGISGRVRVSLAGVQDKLVLTRMADGSWGRPVDGTPSTHLLKPEITGLSHTVENEAFCMCLARHLGVGAAAVETTEIAGRRLIVVERYDRVVSADHTVERLHQEDFCQAFAMSPDTKYEPDGGPSLRRIAAIVASVAEPRSLERLLQAVTVNALIANGDAHAKNFSLLHRRDGSLTLAPLYDLMCTLHYGDDRLAMYIDDVRRSNRVTGERLVNEAVAWGLPPARALEIIHDLLAAAPAAIAQAANETAGLPDAILTIVEAQLDHLRSTS